MMAGFIVLPLIGIATAWIMTNVVVSDLDWQENISRLKETQRQYLRFTTKKLLPTSAVG